MSEMEDKLNSLSPDELNALNNDPELLSAFKTKYGTHGHETLQKISPPNPDQFSQATGLVNQASPSNIGQMAGVASANAPGATLAVSGILPGGNPHDIMSGMKNIQQNPQQLQQAATRAGQVNAGTTPTPQEKLPAQAGQMAGTALEAMIPAEAAAKALPQVGQKVGSTISDIASTLKAPGEAQSRVIADNLITQQAPQEIQKAKAVMQPLVQKAQDAITTIKQSLAQVPQQFAQKQSMLGELNQVAKSAMQKVEETVPGLEFKGGEGFNEYVKNSQKMSQLAEIMAKWQNKIPDNMPLAQQQLFRKLAQEGSDSVNNISRAVLQQGREALANNISNQVPEWGKARDQYLQVQDALKALPADKLGKTTTLKSGLLKAQNDLKDLQTEATNLVSAAKNADAAQLLDIKKQANDLIQKGIKHDQYVKNLWKTAGAVGLATIGIKKFGIGE